MDHLTVLSPEVVAFHIEGIAACLGPSTVALTLPLNAAKCPQLPFQVAIVAGNQVVLQDGIQLPCHPLQVELWGYLTKVSFEPGRALRMVSLTKVTCNAQRQDPIIYG
jgi:hypothetical protein